MFLPQLYFLIGEVVCLIEGPVEELGGTTAEKELTMTDRTFLHVTAELMDGTEWYLTVMTDFGQL
jgi:hypothetical protein